jgi:hypothetical protein
MRYRREEPVFRSKNLDAITNTMIKLKYIGVPTGLYRSEVLTNTFEEECSNLALDWAPLSKLKADLPKIWS